VDCGMLYVVCCNVGFWFLVVVGGRYLALAWTAKYFSVLGGGFVREDSTTEARKGWIGGEKKRKEKKRKEFAN